MKALNLKQAFTLGDAPKELGNINKNKSVNFMAKLKAFYGKYKIYINVAGAAVVAYIAYRLLKKN